MFDTITAISSGNINQPISIIRVSGSESFDIVKKIYSGKVGSHKTITHGYIKDGSILIDEVLVSWFSGTKTFTGESIVEINAHGGVVNSQKILKLLLANGARLAEPGEFTRRAFLNGKIDLIKAEAIHELIFAKTEEQARASVRKFDGKTSKLIKALIDNLLVVIANIETNIDYPEYEDIQDLNNKKVKPILNNVKISLEEIKKSSQSSKYIFEGVNTVIVGKPNAGKSSLLNALLNEDKAIVTDIPGTTRDIVEGQLQIGQVLFNFHDTAGIHKSKDKIENIGMTKSIEAVKTSDLVIHLVESDSRAQQVDREIKKMSVGKVYIKVISKDDNSKIKNNISISVKNNNIDQLITEIQKHFKDINLDDEKILNNTRQLALIDKSLIDIESALNGISNGLEPDEVILDIRQVWKNLANIVGQANDEKLLDSMFKIFCLGK